MLRDRHYFTLVELNAAIREQLDRINHRPMKPVGKSRFESFAVLDRPRSSPCPPSASRRRSGSCVVCMWNYPRRSLAVEARFTASVVSITGENAWPPIYDPGGQPIRAPLGGHARDADVADDAAGLADHGGRRRVDRVRRLRRARRDPWRPDRLGRAGQRV
ncbi:MAG: hypothetical protein ACREV4_02540 [Gammaproteobacteria bacterium]